MSLGITETEIMLHTYEHAFHYGHFFPLIYPVIFNQFML